MNPVGRRTAGGWAWFAAWALVGGGACFAVLAVLTVGMFVAPVVAAAAVLLGCVRRSHRGLPGLISGFGIPPFYLAWLNRDGPGTVCHSTATSTSCIGEWPPWPFAIVGVAVVAFGVVVFLRRTAPPANPLQEILGRERP